MLGEELLVTGPPWPNGRELALFLSYSFSLQLFLRSLFVFLFFFVSLSLLLPLTHAQIKKQVSSLTALPALARWLPRRGVRTKAEARRRAEQRSFFQALRRSRGRRHGLIEAMLRAGLPGPRDETGEPPTPPTPSLPPSHPLPPLPSPLFSSFGAPQSFLFRRCLERRDHLPAETCALGQGDMEVWRPFWRCIPPTCPTPPIPSAPTYPQLVVACITHQSLGLYFLP